MNKKESLNDSNNKEIQLKEELYIEITDSEDDKIISQNEIINIKIINNKNTNKKLFEEDAKEFLNKKRKRQIDKNKKKKINISLEFKLFYKLVDKYGIEKVLSSLCNNENIFSMNEIDKVVGKINDICGKDKFINNIIKTYYFLLKDYMSINPEIKDNLTYKKNFDQQRILSNDDNRLNNLSMTNFQFNVNDIVEISDNNKNNLLGIESHYNKDLTGNIYKYKIMYLLGKLAIFKCADKNCNGDALLDLETKKFKCGQKHDKNYSEHDFVVNKNFDNDIAFKELSNNNNYNDAQILYEGNAKIVRLYC